MTVNPFQEYALQLFNSGYSPVLLTPKTKKPALCDWNRGVPYLPLCEKVEAWVLESDGHNIGVAAGTLLSTGDLFAALDVDTEGFVSFVKSVVGFVSGKVGVHGLTIFARAPRHLESAKFKAKGKKKHGVELMVNSGMLVMPPSNHPDGIEYRHEGRSLHDVAHDELPILDETKFEIIKAVVTNEHAWQIIEGGAIVQGHEPMLALTSCGVANLTDDLEWLADCLNALFHPDCRPSRRTAQDTVSSPRYRPKESRLASLPNWLAMPTLRSRWVTTHKP